MKQNPPVTAPVDEDLANASRQASTLDPERLRNHRTVVDNRERWRGRQRVTDELLEHSHVEHIM